MKTWVKILLVVLLGVGEGLLFGFFPEIGIVLMLILVGPIAFFAEALNMGGNVK